MVGLGIRPRAPWFHSPHFSWDPLLLPFPGPHLGLLGFLYACQKGWRNQDGAPSGPPKQCLAEPFHQSSQWLGLGPQSLLSSPSHTVSLPLNSEMREHRLLNPMSIKRFSLFVPYSFIPVQLEPLLADHLGPLLPLVDWQSRGEWGVKIPSSWTLPGHHLPCGHWPLSSLWVSIFSPTRWNVSLIQAVLRTLLAPKFYAAMNGGPWVCPFLSLDFGFFTYNIDTM